MPLKMYRNPAIRWIATLLLLGLVFRFVNWAELRNALQQTQLGFYLLSTGAFLAAFLLFALRLKTLLQFTELARYSWFQLLNVNVSSMFLGFFLPTDIGTAAVRWYRLTRDGGGHSAILLATLLERVITIVATLVVVVVTLGLSRASAVLTFRQTALPLLVLILLLSTVFLVLLLVPGVHRWIDRLATALRARLKSARLRKVASILRDTDVYAEHPRQLVLAGIVHVPIQCLLILRFVWLFAALQIEIPLVDMIWISMMVLLLTLVPITIAGLGIREAGFATLLGIYGVAPEGGVLVGLLAFSQYVVALLLGGMSVLLHSEERLRAIR